MKKKIVSFFKKNPGRSFKNKDIAKRLQITADYDYAALKATLHKLYEENFLTKNGKRFKLNTIPDDNKITGRLEINQGGFGFVVPNRKEIGDIFIVEILLR